MTSEIWPDPTAEDDGVPPGNAPFRLSAAQLKLLSELTDGCTAPIIPSLLAAIQARDEVIAGLKTKAADQCEAEFDAAEFK